MSDPEKPEVPTKPRRDPAALSSEYHKAHKQLMLWSTILLIWELIGVDLSKAKDAGGNIGPIVTALKSPQAVPWALTGLVFYFLFKCSVEWAQCHIDRRKLRFARADFMSAWVVALAAIMLYVGQTISQIQFANALQTSRLAFLSLTMGILSAMGWLGVAGGVFRRSRRIRSLDKDDVAFLSFFSLLGIIGSIVIVIVGHWRFAVLGIFIGSILVSFAQLTTILKVIQILRRRNSLPKN